MAQNNQKHQSHQQHSNDKPKLTIQQTQHPPKGGLNQFGSVSALNALAPPFNASSSGASIISTAQVGTNNQNQLLSLNTSGTNDTYESGARETDHSSGGSASASASQPSASDPQLVSQASHSNNPGILNMNLNMTVDPSLNMAPSAVTAAPSTNPSSQDEPVPYTEHSHGKDWTQQHLSSQSNQSQSHSLQKQQTQQLLSPVHADKTQQSRSESSSSASSSENLILLSANDDNVDGQHTDDENDEEEKLQTEEDTAGGDVENEDDGQDEEEEDEDKESEEYEESSENQDDQDAERKVNDEIPSTPGHTIGARVANRANRRRTGRKRNRNMVTGGQGFGATPRKHKEGTRFKKKIVSVTTPDKNQDIISKRRDYDEDQDDTGNESPAY